MPNRMQMRTSLSLCVACPGANCVQWLLVLFCEKRMRFLTCSSHAEPPAITLPAVALQLARLKVITRCDKFIKDNALAQQSS
jgi:hypothetical protein